MPTVDSLVTLPEEIREYLADIVLQPSAVIGDQEMEGNTTETDITVQNQWEKIAGVTTAILERRVNASDVSNRLIYQYDIGEPFKLEVSMSVEVVGGANTGFEFAIFKNNEKLSTKFESELVGRFVTISFQGVDTLATYGDFYEVFVRNIDNTQNCVVRDLHFLGSGIFF